MNNFRIKHAATVIGLIVCGEIGSAYAQVSDKGLTPAANTYRSYQNASIVRDSGLSQPLDLLNDFYPAITVTAAKHDNVRRRPDLDEDDLKITAIPSLGYRTNLGRHKFYAAYSGVYTFHQDVEQEDAKSNAVLANLGLDLSRRWDLELFGGFGDSFEERGISGGRDFVGYAGNAFNRGPEKLEYKAYGADLIFGRKIGILKGVLGYEYVETTFSSDDELFRFDAAERDRETEALHLDLEWQFGAKTSVFGRIEETETNYFSVANQLDSTQTDYLIGLRWKPSSALSGVAGIGRSEKDFVSPDQTDYDSSVYYANLNYSFSAFSNLQFAASRQVEEPGDGLSSYYETDFYGIGWNHALSQRLVFDAYYKWSDDHYNTGREDSFVDWGVGLDYVWRSWMTAGIYYGEIERESNTADIAYDDAYIGLRLRSDLRSLFTGSRRDDVEPASFDYPKRTGRSQ